MMIVPIPSKTTRPTRSTADCGRFMTAHANVVTLLHSREGDMTMTTISSRAFNQDVTAAKRAAEDGPVFITDRGRPAHVLLSIDAYRRLTGARRSIVDALSAPGLGDIELDIAVSRALPRAAAFD